MAAGSHFSIALAGVTSWVRSCLQLFVCNQSWKWGRGRRGAKKMQARCRQIYEWTLKRCGSQLQDLIVAAKLYIRTPEHVLMAIQVRPAIELSTHTYGTLWTYGLLFGDKFKFQKHRFCFWRVLLSGDLACGVNVGGWSVLPFRTIIQKVSLIFILLGLIWTTTKIIPK